MVCCNEVSGKRLSLLAICSGLLGVLMASLAAATPVNKCFLHAAYEGTVICQLRLPDIVSVCAVFMLPVSCTYVRMCIDQL